jgi:hypothetical protein
MPDLYLIFNHQLTEIQAKAAVTQLEIQRIHSFPDELQALWGQIPSDIPELTPYLSPVIHWLKNLAKPYDYVLIQGDFGACYILVQEAFRLGLIPIYSTTQRKVVEEQGADGAVRLTHEFRHVIFRKYERWLSERRMCNA